MALTAQITTDVGVPSDYQRITDVRWDAGADQWVITVELYASEGARRSGRRPLETTDVWIPDARLQPSPLRAFYQALVGHGGTALTGAPGDEQAAQTLFVADGLDPGSAPAYQGEVLPVGEVIEPPFPPPDTPGGTE